MTLQIFCTFGHVHLLDESGASALKSIAAADASTVQSSFDADPKWPMTDAGALPPGADGDRLCPLCLVGNLVASAVASSPPALTLPIAYALLGPPQLVADQPGVDAPTGFWSRGPPIS